MAPNPWGRCCFAGYIAAFSESLSMSLIEAQAVDALKDSLLQEPEDHLKVRPITGSKLSPLRNLANNRLPRRLLPHGH